MRTRILMHMFPVDVSAQIYGKDKEESLIEEGNIEQRSCEVL